MTDTVFCMYTIESAKMNERGLGPGICVKYFLTFPQKTLLPEKNETNYVFTFQFLNDKIDQNTNFAKLPSGKWLFLV